MSACVQGWPGDQPWRSSPGEPGTQALSKALRTSQVSIYIYAALEEVLFHRYKYSAFLEPPLLYGTRPAAPKHKSRQLAPRGPFTPLAWAACCNREPTLQTRVLPHLRSHTDPQTSPGRCVSPCHARKTCTQANSLLSAGQPEDLRAALGRVAAGQWAAHTHTPVQVCSARGSYKRPVRPAAAWAQG